MRARPILARGLLLVVASGCAGERTGPVELQSSIAATGAVHAFAAHRFGGGLPDHLALHAAFWDVTFIYPWEPEGTQVCASDDRMAIAGAWIFLTKKEEGITAGDAQRELTQAPVFTFRLLGEGMSIDVPTIVHPARGGASFEVGVRGRGDSCFARTSVGWVPVGLPPGVYGLATVEEGVEYVDSFLEILDC